MNIEDKIIEVKKQLELNPDDVNLQMDLKRFNTVLLNRSKIKLTSDAPDMEAKIINETSADLKTFDSPFGEVIWNQDKKTIECSGAVYSEMEMHDMRDSGIGITDFDLAIRRNFPGGMKIKENTHFTNF